jgi:hypothetical protein
MGNYGDARFFHWFKFLFRRALGPLSFSQRRELRSFSENRERNRLIFHFSLGKCSAILPIDLKPQIQHNPTPETK